MIKKGILKDIYIICPSGSFVNKTKCIQEISTTTPTSSEGSGSDKVTELTTNTTTTPPPHAFLESDYSSEVFGNLFSLDTDRRGEVQKIFELQRFLKTYEGDGEKTLVGDFWTGGQTAFSVEKNRRVWIWRSSKNELAHNQLMWDRGSIPRPDSNDCAGMRLVNGTGGFPVLIL